MNLKKLETMINELNASNGQLDKIAVLKKYSSDADIKSILEYVYSPFKMFSVTSKNCIKNSKLVAAKSHKDIFALLDDLAARKITGHDAIEAVNAFIRDNNYPDLIYNIIDKNLKCRIDASLINKAFDEIVVGTFDVALAKSYDDFASKVDFEKQEWYASRKMDGCRCVAIFDKKGSVSLWSRQGKEFETLGVLKEQLEHLGLKNIVLDGEICVMNGDNEDFAGTMKQIRRKDFTIENPRYLVFDYLSLQDFERQESKIIFSERLNALKENVKQNKYIRILEQKKLTTKLFEEMQEEAAKNGWEGLIIRKNIGYEGKRSNNLLKVKKFKDAEYKVIRIETGPFRIIKNGKEVTVETMTNVVIEHKGNEVSVGSGFTLEEREYFYNNPKKIVGKEITVKFFEECKDSKTGKFSLRFPTVKTIFDNERDV